MRKHIKGLTVIMLAVIMSVMIVLPACSGGGASPSGIQQNVTVGKRVYVDKSGIVYFACRNMICTAVMKDGELSEFVPEAATTGTIYAMAVYNDYLYISANDGFFRYPLSMFSGGSRASAETVMTQPLDAFVHFEIFEDRIFFLSGSSLCCIPVDGGELSEVRKDVYDFEVSDRGIYAVQTDGKMVVISPDLSESRDIGQVAAGVRMTPGGMNLYYRDGVSVMAFSVEKEEAAGTGNTHDASEYFPPWSNGTNVLYRDENYKCYLVTPDGEKELERNYEYPSKNTGYVYGDYLLGNDGDARLMCVINMATGEMKNYDLRVEMKDYINKIGGGKDSDPEPVPDDTKTGSDDFDIMKGFVRNASADTTQQEMYFNQFLLILPNDDDIGFKGEGDHVDFIYIPGQNSGYGGRLVTIKAYDIGDDSYKNLPNYHVAGTNYNVGKTYVAIYPSDLQCDPNDSAQTAKYEELKDYVFRIREGSADSPLAMPDSNPEP